ncbi:hypothetical protein BD413DRAFT_127687 [Trametes elegans]|nr:hypothetical protein BD413DRAFT_127687 [Trametes elegans]
MPRKRQPSPEESSDSEGGQFVVEVIKAARVEDGQWRYRVKWANYDSGEDTWEPEENLRDNCKRLLESFWADIGMDNEDYPEGYTVKATPSWIKREKKLFARTAGGGGISSEGDSDDEPIASTSRVKEEPSTSKGKGKAKATSKPSTGKNRGRPQKITTSAKIKGEAKMNSDDLPLSSISRHGKKRAKAPTPGSDEDDERPLAKVSKPKPPIPRRTTVLAPTAPAAVKPQPPPQEESPHYSGSESAGSLFSGRASSPEVALGAAPTVTTGGGSTIPAKRPATNEAGPSQRRPRQVKEMPMVYTDTAGNPTKARLAQRGHRPPALSSTAAEAAGVAPGIRLGVKKMDLSNLSFKKKSAAAPAPAPTPVRTDKPTIPQPSGSVSDNVQSPVSASLPTPTADSHPPPIPRTTGEARRPSIPIPRRTTMMQPPNDPLAEANAFLSNIMPPEMAAPMHEETTPETPTTPSVPPVTGKPKPPLPRIGKKWRWAGEMFIDVSRDKAERVCEITLYDPTEPSVHGLRFSICMKGDSVRLSAFHDLHTLPLFLDACTRPEQFAKVGPLEDKHADTVNQLAQYMMKRGLFCYAHLYIEETSVALLVLYPAGHSVATQHLKAPQDHAGEALLQAALVPWELKAREFQEAHWKPRTAIRGTALDPQFDPVLVSAERKIVTQRRFYQALHILGFPKALYDFMVAPNHPYCIWYAPGDVTATGPGYETILLQEILRTSSAKDNGYKSSARVVFVHVGALAKLYCLPGLADRRGKSPEVRFVTYGTHASIPRDRWGIREIYPLGGIVTFTPSAIIQGFYRMFKRVKQIAEHPMWECYVLPSVVALVAKLSCQGIHPLQAYDEGSFVYEDLLRAIEGGSIALLQAPDARRDPPPQGDPVTLWTGWMIRVAGLNARGILEECLKLAAEQFANTSDADLPAAIEGEITRDLIRMQVQPAIMDNYRRFVVFRTAQDAGFPEGGRYGIECTSENNFDFKDDYFASNDSTKN